MYVSVPDFNHSKKFKMASKGVKDKNDSADVLVLSYRFPQFQNSEVDLPIYYILKSIKFCSHPTHIGWGD